MSGKKTMSMDGSRNLFALTVTGQSLDVFLREVVISASVYFKLKGYIESHVRSPSGAPLRHRLRAYSGSTETTAADSAFTVMNPLVMDGTVSGAGSISGMDGEDDKRHMDLASLIAVEFCDVTLYDQADRRLADASSFHLSSSKWYPSAHKEARASLKYQRSGLLPKVTYYNNKYPGKTEMILQVGQLALFAIPDDESHHALCEGLTVMYSSSSNQDASLSKLMATSGQLLDIQCQRVSVETTEGFLDHSLQELSLRTIRYLCFGLNYVGATLLAEVEVVVRVDEVCVEVVCGGLRSDPSLSSSSSSSSLSSSYDDDDALSDGGCGSEDEFTLTTAGGTLYGPGPLRILKVDMREVECDVSKPRNFVAFYAQDFRHEVVHVEVEDSFDDGDGADAFGTMVDDVEDRDVQRLVWTLD